MVNNSNSFLKKTVIIPIFIGAAFLLFVPTTAQIPFERILYSKIAGWTVTEYKDSQTEDFLRCSLECYYGDDHNLTIARNLKGYVLGFTSKEWPYKEGSHPIRLQIDNMAPTNDKVRIRVLPGGNVMGFVDLDEKTEIIGRLSDSSNLNVRASEMSLNFALDGSKPAIESVKKCYEDKNK